ncbi:MAG: PASTA domain-containing protein [Ignavibacteriae bacterium]|nr:PASTA domain-containing protein [Ignavibacteriota bacterium]
MDSTNSEQKQQQTKQWQKYAIVLCIFFASLLFLFFLTDKVLIPLIVHSNSTVKVPNVVGMSVSQAKTILEQSHLSVQGIREVSTDKAPAGIVINQLPYSDAEVKEERHIYITVSKGKEMIRAPQLAGKSLRDVRIALMRLGLQLGTVNYDFSETVAADLVVAQSVPPGSETQHNEVISVVISRGSESQITVPVLVFGTLDEAREKLMDAGLILGKVTSVSDATYIDETIISQEPEAGTVVSKNTQVNVSVAK